MQQFHEATDHAGSSVGIYIVHSMKYLGGTSHKYKYKSNNEVLIIK